MFGFNLGYAGTAGRACVSRAGAAHHTLGVNANEVNFRSIGLDSATRERGARPPCWAAVLANLVLARGGAREAHPPGSCAAVKEVRDGGRGFRNIGRDIRPPLRLGRVGEDDVGIRRPRARAPTTTAVVQAVGADRVDREAAHGWKVLQRTLGERVVLGEAG